MGRSRHLSKCFVILVCLAFMLMTGCGSNKEKTMDTAETDNHDTPEVVDTVDSIDENNETENATNPDAFSESTVEDEAQGQDEALRSVTIYYVDDLSAAVVGQKMDISDEYDIWNALIEYGILTSECRLLSLDVNEAERTIDLDFNTATADRINSMGTTGETEIVGCIVNTYLEAYDCTGIKLTVEGQDFVTSHGAEFSDYPGRIVFE